MGQGRAGLSIVEIFSHLEIPRHAGVVAWWWERREWQGKVRSSRSHSGAGRRRMMVVVVEWSAGSDTEDNQNKI